MTGPLAIRAEKLVRDFRPDWMGRRRRALDGMDLMLNPGDVCGLVGANGSGKTTTLRILAGLLRPDSGRVEVLGETPERAARRGRIGFLPDAPEWPPFLSGAGLLARIAALVGIPRPAVASEVGRTVALTGLGQLASRRIGGYSRGERQRLGLAQALLGSPAVLLLDEPASGLDPLGVVQFSRIVRQVAAEGAAVVFSSHFLPQVEEVCDTIVLLDRGRPIFSGTAPAVASAGGLACMFLATAVR